MSVSDIRELTGRDRKSRRRPSSSRSCETDSRRTRQDDVVSDDSDFYDTDLELSTSKSSAAERKRRWSMDDDCVVIYLTTCELNNVAPQVAIVKGLPETEVNKNSTVTHLHLAGNNIGALGTVYLKTVLTLNQNITYLNLSENNLGRDSASSASISDMLRVNTGLQTLILAKNNLRDQDAGYLAAGIMVNSSLVYLDLSHNLIAETGGVHLGRALATNNNIDVLNLSGNCIRHRGAVAICRGLQENGYVSKLDLSWNGFGYEGALAVGELLKKNIALTEIDLSSNRINWQGIRLIAKGLSHNKTLEILRLDMNPLTTTGCMDLIDVIAAHQETALNNLSLKGIPVLSDFELVSLMIKHSRPEFVCQHGGVVSSPDIIGRRFEKRVTPIEKVIQFMKDREYRTSEFFRILDKDGGNKMTHEELASRMLRLGVRLQPHEIEELMDFIQNMNDNQSTHVSFKSMSRGVKGHQNRERMEKIREQKQDERIRKYHKEILTGPDDGATAASDLVLPPIHDYDPEEDKRALLATLKAGAKPAATVAPAQSTAGTGNVMSMSVSLGGKSVPFGKAGGGKKKKKTRKKAGKTKELKNYDDEGVGLA